jgi:hypothetical protein
MTFLDALRCPLCLRGRPRHGIAQSPLEQRLFELQTLTPQELPHCIVRDLDPACSEFGFQAGL